MLYTCGIETELATHPKVYERLTGGTDSKKDDKSSIVHLGMLNGGRPYVDQNSFELATPECASIDDVVLYDKANERIAALVAKFVGKWLFYKNNVAAKTSNPEIDAAYGRHENFSFYDAKRRPVSLSAKYAPMHLFLATRTMLDGSGYVDRRGQYRTSQRAAFAALTNRTINIENSRRPTAVCYNKESTRVQICSGDSTQSDIQTWLNMSVTRIMLGLVLNSEIDLKADDEEVVRIFNQLPYEFEHFGNVKIKTSKGRMTPFEVQRYFLNCALELGYDDPTLHEYLEKLQALESGDYMKLKEEIDWVTKLWRLRRFMERRGLSMGSSEVRMLNITFHRLGYDESTYGLYQILRKERRVKTRLKDDDIDSALRTAPNTRARGRALASCYGLIPNFSTWNGSLIKRDANMATAVEMKDPFETYENEVRRYASASGLIFDTRRVLPDNLDISFSLS